MPTLELLFNKKYIDNFSIGAGDTLLIGRNSVNDIVIDNLAVSAQHAKIESIGKEFLLVDLQSENGSFANDRQIKSHWLKDGDIITIGKHMLKFSNPINTQQEPIKAFNNTKTMRIDTKRYRELLSKNRDSKAGVDQSPKLEVTKQTEQISVLSYLTGKKQNIRLNAKIIRIGKDPDSDILVRGFRIGKTSAVINRLADGWHINYVGGISKPRINNEILKKSVKLNNFDIISIGSTKLQFLILESSPAK
jgi:pSer/pThr/pTyr-binding forkhead associated (FHA) protein